MLMLEIHVVRKTKVIVAIFLIEKMKRGKKEREREKEQKKSSPDAPLQSTLALFV